MSVLTRLIDDDVDISFRAVVKAHSGLASASAILRDPARLRLVNEAKVKQATMRQAACHKQGDDAEMKRMRAFVTDLEAKLRALSLSHAACIEVVHRFGGMSGLRRFWEETAEVRDLLAALGSLPEEAKILAFVPEARRVGKEQT